MVILAVDPGNTESAFVRWDGTNLFESGKVSNDALLDILTMPPPSDYILVLEGIASYGMAVGKEVFETCIWIGRFMQRWVERGGKAEIVYRKDVKLHHCLSTRAKDSNVRQALIDRFGAPGTKKQPGLTYGLKADTWSAFALATCYFDVKMKDAA